MIQEILGAIAFLTRLPVPGVDWQIPLHRMSAWFPVAGLVVGSATAGVYWGTALMGLSLPAAVLAAITAEMWLTGALHPDGLADTADGLGGATPERRLEIMKDPRLGTYGGIALFVTLSGRLVLLTALPAGRIIPGLILAHTLCRWAPVWALVRYPYARSGGGTGAGFVGGGWREILIAGLTAVGAAWLLAGSLGLLAAVVSGVTGVAAIALLARKMGGVTGDLCGAVTEISLLTALAVLSSNLPGPVL